MEKKCLITHVNNRLVFAEFQDAKCCDLQIIDNNSIVGNIFVGRVENVVKNINCAFIEIQKGVKCYYSLEDNKKHIFLNRKNSTNVNTGDIMLVQIEREAIKTKPATATSKLSINGRYVVISSDVTGVAVSGKIKKDDHCKMLKKELLSHFDKWKTEYDIDFGFILRTNSANAELNDILYEADKLVKQLSEIYNRAKYEKAFSLLYKAPSEYLNEIKSIRNNSETEIVTDDSQIYDEINKTLNTNNLSLRLYNDELLPLYKLYSLETEIDRALSKKVWLKSGGYIIIEQTEALTVIDVNSGKQIGKKGGAEAKEKSVTITNIEAAKEITRQMRLRNLSGIIIVDFINMSESDHNSELITLLRELLKHDTQPASVIDITKLGLVEITRKKSGKSLVEAWNGVE